MSKYLTASEVKTIRNKLRLSQEKLARLSKISRYHLHQHENGLNQLSEEDMVKIYRSGLKIH